MRPVGAMRWVGAIRPEAPWAPPVGAGWGWARGYPGISGMHRLEAISPRSGEVDCEGAQDSIDRTDST